MKRRTASHPIAIFAMLAAVAGCDDQPCPTCPDQLVYGAVYSYTGRPVAGATVEVFGHPAVTTDADGQFSVPDVDVPYDIAVVQEPVHVWRGVTRLKTVLYVHAPEPPVQSARVSGHLPPAPGTTTVVAFAADNVIAPAWAVAHDVTGEYGFDVHWPGGLSARLGTLWVLRWTRDAAGTPANYTAFAMRDLGIADGSSHTEDFAGTELWHPQATMIYANLSSAYQIEHLLVRLESQGDPVPLFDARSSVDGNGDFRALVPYLPIGTFQLFASARHRVGITERFSQAVIGGISPRGCVVRLLLNPAADLAPVDPVTAVTPSTLFSWTQPGGAGTGVYELKIRAYDSAHTLHVVQSGDTFRFDDIPSTVFRPLAGENHQWSVRRLLDLPAPDFAAEDNALPHLYGQRDETASDLRVFTAAP